MYALITFRSFTIYHSTASFCLTKVVNQLLGLNLPVLRGVGTRNYMTCENDVLLHMYLDLDINFKKGHFNVFRLMMAEKRQNQ